MYRKQSLYKIYLVLVLILVVITGSTLYVVQSRTTEMISGLTINQAEAANRALANYIVELQDKSLERAQIIAGNEAVANSINQGDYADLAKTIANLGEGMDFVTVCDTNGVVLARSHSEIVGDDLSRHSAIAAIFRRGADEGRIEDIPTLGPAIRASSVIYSDNRFIGIIACGFRLTNYSLLDEFKSKNACEASIFYDGSRINTTVRDEHGRRIVGRTVDARIIEQVINNATPFIGQQTLFGAQYRAHYSPIIVDKQVVGMLFTGVDISATLMQQRQMQNLILVIIATALAATGVFLIATSRFNRMISSAMVEISDKTASLNMLENVLDGLDVFLYITDSQTDKLLFVNKALITHFNLQQDVIGDYCYNIFQTGYEERCPHCSLRRLEQDSDEFVIWEGYNNITGRYYRNIDRLIDWPDGKVAHFCQRIDMTDTKQAMEEAERASRAKSDFLSRMSHEMRTPMNAIMGMAALAQKEDCGEETRKYCQKITDSAGHLLRIIDDVLHVSQLGVSQMQLAETDFMLQDMLEHLTEVMEGKMKQKQQHFTVGVSKDMPAAIVADRHKLTQVITHLLDNAVKFTPEGGNMALYCMKTADDGRRCKLLIEVEDDGVGIPEEQREHIFGAFEQGDNTITRQYGGTGLGLTISQNIVQSMGGEIWAEARPDKGSVFGFTIEVGIGESATNTQPQKPEPEPEPETEPADSLEDVFSGKHVLLVDDVELNRDILGALLEDMGISSEGAENGREACDKFAANPAAYDLILMDIHMPEMTGHEATQKIRAMQLQEAKTIPIIAVTADIFNQDIEKCLQSGMNDYVGKPLDMEVIIEKLKLYL